MLPASRSSGALFAAAGSALCCWWLLSVRGGVVMELIILIVAGWLAVLITSIVLGHMLAGRSPAGSRRPRR